MREVRYDASRAHVATAVIEYIREYGPSSLKELREALKVNPNRAVNLMTKDLKTIPKRMYVFDYIREETASGAMRWHARYAIGNKKDAVKPKPDMTRNCRQWRHREKAKINSVFMLGMTRKQRAAYRRALTPGLKEEECEC